MAGTDYRSARSLGLALGMRDGSQVTKWLNGRTQRINDQMYQRQLAQLLKTPPDYFQAPKPRTLAEVEADLNQLRRWVTAGFQALGVAPDLADAQPLAPSPPGR